MEGADGKIRREIASLFGQLRVEVTSEEILQRQPLWRCCATSWGRNRGANKFWPLENLHFPCVANFCDSEQRYCYVPDLKLRVRPYTLSLSKIETTPRELFGLSRASQGDGHCMLEFS